ncbi:MAG TPA: signal peptidase II [Candidatus Limnocylindrales bacterium]|nr:signal peptidase II [Candidatus Limnocylindrales bacterium]
MGSARRTHGGGEELDQAAAGSTTRIDGGRTRPADATRGRPRWALFATLAAGILVVDQVTKAWVAANVPSDRPVRVVDDYVRLVISHNTGGLFGMFRDLAPILALASVAVIGLIVWYHGRSGRSLVLTTALGLLLGGALGNLTDRLRLGYVLDFVDAGIGDLRWYTFNVADAAISTALLMLVLVAVRPSLAGGGGARPEGETGADA